MFILIFLGTMVVAAPVLAIYLTYGPSTPRVRRTNHHK